MNKIYIFLDVLDIHTQGMLGKGLAKWQWSSSFLPNQYINSLARPQDLGRQKRKLPQCAIKIKKTITSSLAKCQPYILLNFQKHCYRDL